MEQARIFVSHSPYDKAFTEPIVEALREIGADVWYDDRDVSAEPLRDEIQREIASRSRFIVILSRAALASPHVLAECAQAYALQRTEHSRIMLPILVEHLEDRDLNDAPYLRNMRRVEANYLRPLTLDKIVSLTPWYLGLAMLESAPISDDLPPDVLVKNLTMQAAYIIGQHQYAIAIEFLERATQLAPDNYDAWYRLAQAHTALQQWEPCLDALNHLLTLPEYGYRKAPSLQLKAYALSMLGHHEEAVATYDEALTINTNDADDDSAWRGSVGMLHPIAWTGKGTALGKLGRYDEALAAYDRALTMHPNASFILVNKANTLRDLHHYDEALTLYDRILAQAPRDAQAWREKATTLRAAGRDDEADAAEQHLKELGG
ncbi:MAG: tetratricopeptide repeat protein [Ktedonobacterales bacterium]